jgi:hypothetical protein
MEIVQMKHDWFPQDFFRVSLKEIITWPELKALEEARS